MSVTKKKATISIDIDMANKIKSKNLKLSTLIHKLLKNWFKENDN
jgi:hypothetical protein